MKITSIRLLASIVLLASLLSVNSALASLASIVSVNGQAEVRMSVSAQWTVAVTETDLDAGAQIRTGTDGKVALLLADESMIQLGRNSSFTVKSVGKKADWFKKTSLDSKETEKQSRYEVGKGVMWLLNKHKQSNILVDTPSVTAAIRGTEIRIEVLEDQTSKVGVLEGEVLAYNELGSVSLFAGEQAVARPGSSPVKEVLLNPYDAVQWTIYVPRLLTSTSYQLTDFPFPDAVKNNDIFMRGIKLRGAGDLNQALKNFNQLAGNNVLRSYALAASAWVAMDREQLQQAGQILGDISSNEDFVRVTQIQWLIEQKQLAKAAAIIRALQIDKKSAWYSNQMAWIALLNGSPSVSKQLIESASEKNVTSSQILAVAALMLDEKGLAKESVAEAVQTAPGNVNSWIVRSMIEQSEFNLQSSERSIRKALEIDPVNILALLRLARLRFANDDTPSAEKITLKILSINSDDADANNLMGFIKLAQQESQQALEYFYKAITANPDAADPHLGVSLVEIRQGNEAEALRSISTAVLLDPRRSLYRSYWAKMLHQFERYDRALDVLDIAKNLDKQDPTPFLYRAMILRDLNRPGEAVKELNKAISLNDNKAVYRSRSLLDKDLATKNVDLSLAFTDLGLERWAEQKAVSSVQTDYSNASAHIFYAGALAEKDERSFARNTENLLGRLLTPANSNSFSSFNDYTTFFEQPKVEGEVILTVGSHDKSKAEVYASGANTDPDIAYLVFAGYDHTNGWNGINGEEISNLVSYLKWDINDRDGLFLTASWSDSTRDGKNFSKYLYNEDTYYRHNDFSEVETYRIEAGFHRKVDQSNDLLFHIQHLGLDQNAQSQSCFVFIDSCEDNYIDLIGRSNLEQPFSQFQGQWIYKKQDHQVISGLAYYKGHDDADTEILLSVNGNPGISFGSDEFTTDRESLTVFVQDIMQISNDLTLESAVYFDDYSFSDPLVLGSNAQWDDDFFINPRLGLSWQISPETGLHLAGYRYVLPFYSDRLEPSSIASIPVYRNAVPGSEFTEFDLRLTHEWENTFFTADIFQFEQSKRYLRNNVFDKDKAETKGFALAINSLIGNQLGFSVDYQYLDVDDDDKVTLTNDAVYPLYAYRGAYYQNYVALEKLKQHKIVSGLNWVHPSGHELGGKLTLSDIDYAHNVRPDEQMAFLDLEYAYTLPDKSMSFKIEAKNLFNERFNWPVNNYEFSDIYPEQQVLLKVTVAY